MLQKRAAKVGISVLIIYFLFCNGKKYEKNTAGERQQRGFVRTEAERGRNTMEEGKEFRMIFDLWFLSMSVLLFLPQNVKQTRILNHLWFSTAKAERYSSHVLQAAENLQSRPLIINDLDFSTFFGEEYEQVWLFTHFIFENGENIINTIR